MDQNLTGMFPILWNPDYEKQRLFIETQFIAHLLWQGIMGNKGHLEVGADELSPQVILTAVCRNALPHKVCLIYHDLPCGEVTWACIRRTSETLKWHEEMS